MEIDSKKLMARLLEAANSKADKIPDGYRSRHEWEKEWGVSMTQAKKLLKAGVENGIMECRSFRVIMGQKICHIPYYGPIEVDRKKPKNII